MRWGNNRGAMWLLLISAATALVSTNPVAGGDEEREALRAYYRELSEVKAELTKLQGTAQLTEDKIKSLKEEKDLVKSLIVGLKEDDEVEKKEIAGLMSLTQENRKMAEELCCALKKCVTDEEAILCGIQTASCEVKTLICLAEKIKRNIKKAKRRAFTVGLLIGLGIRFGAGGVGGIPLPIPSPGIW